MKKQIVGLPHFARLLSKGFAVAHYMSKWTPCHTISCATEKDIWKVKAPEPA